MLTSTARTIIEGRTAMMQCRFDEQAEIAVSQQTRTVKIKNETPRQRAERAAYHDKIGFWHPGTAIASMLKEAGSYHKQKGNRKSLKYIVPAGVIVLNDRLYIRNGDRKTLAPDFEVDSRPVVIPATKGKIMAHRPRFDVWSMTFDLQINEDILDAETVYMLLKEGGERIGIGAFRPEKGGPYGLFNIVEWGVLDESSKKKTKAKRQRKRAVASGD